MKSINISGQTREGRGKAIAGRMRAEGMVPCELYGKSGNIHFQVFVNDFKPLVYSPETYIVNLEIDGKTYSAVKKEVQFHPVSDEIIHVDFHEFDDAKKIKLQLPVKLNGTPQGVREGGKLIRKLRTITVKGLPKDMPASIDIDVTSLGLGKSVKVKDIDPGKLEIVNAPSIPVATIDAPRSAKKDAEAAAK